MPTEVEAARSLAALRAAGPVTEGGAARHLRRLTLARREVREVTRRSTGTIPTLRARKSA